MGHRDPSGGIPGCDSGRSDRVNGRCARFFFGSENFESSEDHSFRGREDSLEDIHSEGVFTVNEDLSREIRFS
jgi:hypothetical protein